MEQDIYKEIYSDKQQPTWIQASEERKVFVEQVRAKFTSPVRVLDIGCGNGTNSSWIGNERDSKWVGIDTVDQATLDLELPENGVFIQGDFYEEVEKLDTAFDIIIDQAAILTGLADHQKIEAYLRLICSKLENSGTFIILTAHNPAGDVSYQKNLPDGRLRTFFASSAFHEKPFNKYFSVGQKQITTYDAQDKRNPYASVAENTESVSIIQVELMPNEKR